MHVPWLPTNALDEHIPHYLPWYDKLSDACMAEIWQFDVLQKLREG